MVNCQINYFKSNINLKKALEFYHVCLCPIKEILEFYFLQLLIEFAFLDASLSFSLALILLHECKISYFTYLCILLKLYYWQYQFYYYLMVMKLKRFLILLIRYQFWILLHNYLTNDCFLYLLKDIIIYSNIYLWLNYSLAYH